MFKANGKGSYCLQWQRHEVWRREQPLVTSEKRDGIKDKQKKKEENLTAKKSFPTMRKKLSLRLLCNPNCAKRAHASAVGTMQSLERALSYPIL
ncbi:hypothetical protein HKD37_14G038820 [Glycine soja]